MLIMMIGIFIVSNDLGSADHTRPVLASIVKRFLPWLAKQMTSGMIDVTDYIIRKVAHVTEYTILSILVSRSFGVATSSSLRQRIMPTVITSTYALSDEYHQSFVPSRGATYTDVMWDTLGASIGSGLLLWIQQKRTNRKP
jgi:VanZ family protein